MAEKKKSKEEIVEGFNRLRQEQRSVASKIAELEADKMEHNLVIDALNEVDASRKCFRLIEGVLVERTVKEVLPALAQNKDKISSAVDALNTNLMTKGKELNEYREKYNISVRGENPAGGDKSVEPVSKSSQTASVLVSNAK